MRHFKSISEFHRACGYPLPQHPLLSLLTCQQLLHCSFGAAQLRPHLIALAGAADTLVMAYPNAGLPNDLGEYDEAAEETAAQVLRWAEQGLINIVGGCCGTTPAHIAAIAKAVAPFAPRVPAAPPTRTVLAGLDPMILAA